MSITKSKIFYFDGVKNEAHKVDKSGSATVGVAPLLHQTDRHHISGSDFRSMILIAATSS